MNVQPPHMCVLTASQSLRARFVVLKYLNRLVTPLLNYVDLSHVEATAGAGALTDPSLSDIVHRLKGALHCHSIPCHASGRQRDISGMFDTVYAVRMLVALLRISRQ